MRLKRSSIVILLFLIPTSSSEHQEVRINSIDWIVEVKLLPTVVEDWKWVVLTIAQEASSEPYEGKLAVAEVIRNRITTKFNSDGSIPGTVLAKFQFSGWNTNDPNRIRVAEYDISHPVMVECIKAYNEAFYRASNITRGANLYHADYMNPFPEWTKSPNVDKVAYVGRHIFYIERR